MQHPLSIVIVGWLFIAAGTVGFVYHAGEFRGAGPFDYDVALVLIIRLLAIVGGVFLLRGANWARWLLLAWIAYHVILSAFHTLPELAMHGVLCVAVYYTLFHTPASAYFQPER